MRPTTVFLLLCTCVGVLAAASPQPTTTDVARRDHGPAAVDVTIRDFAFTPQLVHVAREGTVTWTHDDTPAHNLTARDRSFSRTLGNGDTFTIEVGDQDRFIDYYCGIHPSMTGRIVVGDGPPPSELPVVRVPEDNPDLALAVLLASPDTVIDVAPGQYLLDEPLAPAAAGVTIRGRGAVPGDVRITPGLSTVTPAVRIEVDGVTLDNLRLVSFRDTVVDVGDIDGFSMRDVEVVALDGGRRDGQAARVGVHIAGANGVGLTDVVVADAADVGIDVATCDACAVGLRRVALHGNATGLRVGDGAAVVARDLVISGGRVGVRVDARGRPATVDLRRLDVRAGRVGIWLTGVRASVLAALHLQGHAVFGLAVEGAAATDLAVSGVEAQGNAVDVGWDGLGTSTCFDLGDASTDPPTLADTAACTAAAPASPYWPVVTARLVAP